MITRREHEEVVIGPPGKPIGVVRVCWIGRGQVQIGFEFPRNIDIHRREVADIIIKEIQEGTREP